MKPFYAGIIINSFSSVLDSFSTSKVLSTDIKIQRKQVMSCDITVYIGLVGDIDAKVYMSMNATTGMSLASEMLGGMEMKETDELVTSAVAEFCNMIMGTACTRLNGQNLTVDITPPIVRAEQFEVTCEFEPSYSISIQLEDQRSIDFDVSLKNAG